MRSNITEFSYGYAVTEEIVESNKLIMSAAPYFPSLIEEGKKGGYDVKIPMYGNPIFLQFKLSDYLKKKNSKEYKYFFEAYYRMHLRKKSHSNQHQLLIDLENATKNAVFYITPEFHEPHEFNNHYLNGEVLLHSTAFSPSEIKPLPDDEEHYLVFKKGATDAYFCSDDPQKTKKHTITQGINYLVSSLELEPKRLSEEYLHRMTITLLDLIHDSNIRTSQNNALRDIVLRIEHRKSSFEAISYLARTYFDSQFFILPNK